ncbi:MAG: amino acid ABC transporter permease [Clostridia bacterium]|nr:amino acid ABC transporter permease [Clostridia bacterium]
MTLATMIMKMSEGLGKTCAIFFLTLLFSLPLGMIVALLRRSKIKVISKITQFCISVLRGTPLMLQLLAVTYGPYYLSVAVNKLSDLYNWSFYLDISISRNKLIPVVIAFAINYAAYFAEIYRSGLESMPVGQYEAAHVLGYSKPQTFMKIILPQVIRRILPSMTNEIVTLVKDTSMAFTVSYQEMFTIGKQVANSQTSFVPFIIAGVFYYIFNAIVGFVMGRVEKSMSYYTM